MTTQDWSATGRTGVEALLDASPAVEVHTSAAALLGFLCGLGALVAAPFSVTYALALLLGLLGMVLGVGGVVATSRPLVAGRALAPLGMLLSLVALALLGLRFANLDTAFGDDLVPALTDLLERLGEQLPAP